MIDTVKYAPTHPMVGPPLPRAVSVAWPWNGPTGELAARMVNALASHTIGEGPDEITYGQMNNICHRLAHMPTNERQSPLRVADAIQQEIGAAKALKYVELALKNGLITAHDYDIMRASLILQIPKEEIGGRSAGSLARELIEGQKELHKRLREMPGSPSKSDLLRPVSNLDKQVQKFKRQIGM